MSRSPSKDSPLIFITLLVLLIFCWIEVDLYAPSFPQMRRAFGTTQAMVQLTLSLNFLGYLLSSLVVGPLADSCGRRPVLLAGSSVFVSGTVWPCSCIFAQVFEAFPDLKGSACSLLSSIRMAVMAGAIALAGALYEDTFKPIGVLMFSMTLAGFLLLLVTLRRER